MSPLPHIRAAAVVAGLIVATSVAAPVTKTLPEPPRTVYRCEADGKVTYSDEPCLGAKRVDLEPTRGLNKSSGRERIGPDIAREHRHEGFAEAVRPVTGMDAAQLKTAGRRMKLAPEAQQECRWLDRELPFAERDEQRAAGADRSNVQQRLLALRKRYRALGC